MRDGFLHWPKIMPTWAYRDPQTIGDGKGDGVPRETIATQTPAPQRDQHDRYYTQARRLHIQTLMRCLRIQTPRRTR